MCTAGKISIVEVEEIVDVGQLPEDGIHVPAIYVDRVVKGTKYEKRIEVSLIFTCFKQYSIFFPVMLFPSNSLWTEKIYFRVTIATRL